MEDQFSTFLVDLKVYITLALSIIGVVTVIAGISATWAVNKFKITKLDERLKSIETEIPSRMDKLQETLGAMVEHNADLFKRIMFDEKGGLNLVSEKRCKENRVIFDQAVTDMQDIKKVLVRLETKMNGM